MEFTQLERKGGVSAGEGGGLDPAGEEGGVNAGEDSGVDLP